MRAGRGGEGEEGLACGRLGDGESNVSQIAVGTRGADARREDAIGVRYGRGCDM